MSSAEVDIEKITMYKQKEQKSNEKERTVIKIHLKRENIKICQYKEVSRFIGGQGRWDDNEVEEFSAVL